MKLKLCGIRRIEDVEIVNSVRPDYIGFVFYKKSFRYISPQSAKILSISLKSGISPVGVFVNESAEAVAEIARVAGLKAVQLHGDEDEEYIKNLRALYGGEIWKAVRVRSEADVENALSSSADMLLFDAFSKTAYGGTGENINLSLLAKVNPQRPYFLAGGINAQNLRAVLSAVTPYGIDMSGGFETDGVKDKYKLDEFMEVFSEKG